MVLILVRISKPSEKYFESSSKHEHRFGERLSCGQLSCPSSDAKCFNCAEIVQMSSIPIGPFSSISPMIISYFILFKFNCLPFSIIRSPTIFRDVMNNVVDDLSNVNNCHDDPFVHGPDDQEHDFLPLKTLKAFCSRAAVSPMKMHL
ncbi:unnamed protein product [Schistosoma curassoni]|uniref:Reverse transcriptase domain-containing protein n=1 Tax=Schistosoma curassoni TaxID=6186 RepID=A0A183KWW1_9TREM|nr:unnamed protein product [Schistosoma curassoni]